MKSVMILFQFKNLKKIKIIIYFVDNIGHKNLSIISVIKVLKFIIYNYINYWKNVCSFSFLREWIRKIRMIN